MRNNKINQFIFLLVLMLPAAWCYASTANSPDGESHIEVKVSHVQSIPKGSTIQATIDGHTLTVVFTENLGQVAVEVSSASGTSVHYSLTPTPNGVQVYTNNAQNKGVSVT